MKTRKITLAKNKYDCFGGPLESFNNGHINTPEQASLYKAGHLKLPGGCDEIVSVKFWKFEFNSFFNRTDAIFNVTDGDGEFVGSFFASAFKAFYL